MTNSENLPKSIKELQMLDIEELQVLLNRYFKETTPGRPLGKSGLIRALWYRIQCDIHRKYIARRHITRLNRYAADPEGSAEKSYKTKYHLHTGLEIVKTFKGREYKVQVKSPTEFIYDNQSFKSLSAIAMAICGKKVSGYDFFGLNNRSSKIVINDKT